MIGESVPLLGDQDTVEVDLSGSAQALAWSQTADRRTIVHWLWETFVQPVLGWLGWR